MYDFQAQSFGPKACILMRVVETIDPNSSSEDVPDNSPSTLTPLISNPGPPTGIYFFINIFFYRNFRFFFLIFNIYVFHFIENRYKRKLNVDNKLI